MVDYDFSDLQFIQLETPTDLPTVVITTTLGSMTAVLYPEYAPNTVDNFLNRVNEGFYDGKDIYGVEPGGMFLTGAADEKHNGGITNDGEPIPNEYSVKLWPFRGSLLSYYGKQGFGDSRFFAVDSVPFGETEAQYLRELMNKNGEYYIPEELVDAFLHNENAAGFAGMYTVFGQITDGLDVLDKITSTPVTGTAPTYPIHIESIKVVQNEIND
jgi:peptidyl-prolyl cis-trans isomerase B (cyclophilin B)